MKPAVMQPRFLHRFRYVQLMAAIDDFVVYDDIRHTPKRWINRNRVLHRGRDILFTRPLKYNADHLHMHDREANHA